VLDSELDDVVVSVEAADEDDELELVEVVTSLLEEEEEETLLVEDEAEALAEDEEEEAGISFAPEIQLALTAAPTAFFM
jgi:CheY-like chemotaxis protein